MPENSQRSNDRAAVMRLFFDLGRLDQIECAGEILRSLNFDEPIIDDELLKQRDSLRCLVAAAEYLGLTRPIKVAEYREAAKALDLDWSWQQIHRAWEGFARAADRAAGGPAAKTSQELDFQSKYRNRHNREEPRAAIRRWLATEPPKVTGRAYDAWAREYNLAVASGALAVGTQALPRLSSMYYALALPWDDVLRSARGEAPLAGIVRERRDARDWSRGPHDFVSRAAMALDHGININAARRLFAEPFFPRPALILRERRAWLREEVDAYMRGERPPLKEANRLRHLYLTGEEVGEMFALSPRNVIREPERFAPCAGSVANVLYWLRADVEPKVAAMRPEIERRRLATRGASRVGTRTPLVTPMSLSRELGMTFGQVQGLINQPGFPEPLKKFGEDGGVWLRAAVEAHLSGRDLDAETSALAAKLGPEVMTSKEATAYLSLSPRRQSRDRDRPPPAGLVGSVGHVYLKGEIDSWLHEKPRRVELLERRKAMAERAQAGIKSPRRAARAKPASPPASGSRGRHS